MLYVVNAQDAEGFLYNYMVILVRRELLQWRGDWPPVMRYVFEHANTYNSHPQLRQPQIWFHDHGHALGPAYNESWLRAKDTYVGGEEPGEYYLTGCYTRSHTIKFGEVFGCGSNRMEVNHDVWMFSDAFYMAHHDVCVPCSELAPKELQPRTLITTTCCVCVCVGACRCVCRCECPPLCVPTGRAPTLDQLHYWLPGAYWLPRAVFSLPPLHRPNNSNNSHLSSSHIASLSPHTYTPSNPLTLVWPNKQ